MVIGDTVAFGSASNEGPFSRSIDWMGTVETNPNSSGYQWDYLRLSSDSNQPRCLFFFRGISKIGDVLRSHGLTDEATGGRKGF